MLEDGVGRRGPGVVADEDHGVERLVQAFHHAQRAIAPVADEQSLRAEKVGQDVAAGVVGVADDDFRRPGGQGALDGGIGLGRHQAPEQTVIVAADGDIVPADDAAHAFHVHADEDFQALGRGLPRRGGAGQDEQNEQESDPDFFHMEPS